jgi:hypothetical protein
MVLVDCTNALLTSAWPGARWGCRSWAYRGIAIGTVTAYVLGGSCCSLSSC